jgi:hypothetical protein
VKIQPTASVKVGTVVYTAVYTAVVVGDAVMAGPATVGSVVRAVFELSGALIAATLMLQPNNTKYIKG